MNDETYDVIHTTRKEIEDAIWLAERNFPGSYPPYPYIKTLIEVARCYLYLLYEREDAKDDPRRAYYEGG